ncbi:MAG: helix-turn-helix domain-containing protein [Bacteroidaceae bacterium]|nr:helix-turn-helix domain-containing protein [Bacteroidaceae bacterium]
MSLQINLGIAILQLRKLQGLSQERLALEADIDRRYMSDVENGKRNISLDIIERIASRLGIDVSELLRYAENVGKDALTIDSLKEWLCENDHEDTVVLESPDYLSAIVGISEEGRLIYSYDKMVEHLMTAENMDAEEAMEFIDYNTIRALPYAGEMTPIVLYDIEN